MFSIMQIVLIIIAVQIISYFGQNCQLFVKFAGQQVFRGFVIGLIMGDIETGLIIGGTMQLMAMGLAAYGGASIPNYSIAVIIGTAYAIATKSEAPLELALAIGVPVATLGTSLDVFAKSINSFWYHLAEKNIDKGNPKKLFRTIILGDFFFGRAAMCNTYPVALCLIFGQPIIELIITYMPAWLTSCLGTVSGILPALGMAILMLYMPVKENFHWLVIGFVLYVYFGLEILPIAIVGGVVAYVYYKNLQKDRNLQLMMNSNAGGIGDE